MPTARSSLQASERETLAALDEIRRHHDLLIGSWRHLLETVRARIEQLGESQHDHLALRTARATAATAAGEAAQAARLQTRLLKLSPSELARARAELEEQINSFRDVQSEAAGHLHAAVENAAGALTARLTADHAAQQSATIARYETRFAEDLVRIMRAYRDRLEQALLDFAEAAHAVFGTPMGGALPTGFSRQPPRPDLDHIAISDAARLPSEIADTIWRLVELYREGLDSRGDETIRALRSRLDSAAEDQRRGEDRVRDRIAELADRAQALDQLAESLDWMLPLDGDASARR